MLQKAHIRIARPTNQLDNMVEFYEKALGFQQLGSFKDHAGFDGVMVGFPGLGYHLEFTQCRRSRDIPTPSYDDLLVFYVPEPGEWQAIIGRMESHGIAPVSSFNPYWDQHGRTYEDPDGFRLVIQNSNWQ